MTDEIIEQLCADLFAEYQHAGRAALTRAQEERPAEFNAIMEWYAKFSDEQERSVWHVKHRRAVH